MPEKNTDCACSLQHYHGTHQCYRTCKCRKQECKDANAAAVRALRKKKAYGTSTTHTVDATPVRKHLHKLMKYGWGVRAITRETNIPTSTLNAIVYGEKGKLRETVTAETANKILAFNPPFAREARQGTSTPYVRSGSAQKKLQALTALGYSLSALAEDAGYSRSYFKQVMGQDRIGLERQRAVNEVYERLWNKLPVATTPMQKRSIDNARKRAEENGWRPPMGMALLINQNKDKAVA
jgi:lambda repressor-like predicted transcriptional regulator